MNRDVSILPGLTADRQPKDNVLLCYVGTRLVASAARVAEGPSWVVVGFGAAHGFQAVAEDVRAALVELAGGGA